MIFINIALLIIIIGLAIYIVIQRSKSNVLNENISLLQQRLDNLHAQNTETFFRQQEFLSNQLNQITNQITEQLNFINKQLTNTTGQIGIRLDKAATVIADVSKGLGSLSEASRQILEIGKDLSKLQEILRAPKQRGLLGEFFLEDLLRQILPHEYYEVQYKFKNGNKVDAIIKLGPNLVPIDAKFPLDEFARMCETVSTEERRKHRREFLRTVKNHIDDIALKYIQPNEGTYDFAMMYIPAENVYYEIIIKEDPEEESIQKYALAKKVIPVSPNSIYAYLQAIILGLRGLRIEQSAQKILAALQKLTNDFNEFKEEFRILGTHIRNAQTKFGEAEKSLINFEQKLISVENIERENIINKLEDK
ncbi:MAG: DNA recombination protein RmuC [candidate division WOR-3 bacterium]|nr:DNA recombination protein RmuC [candidate division WOR-3 bacterium]MCX7757972.1 DNA recombination protein RmuC [candidate division WOR-3 bacterium]